MTDKDFMQLAIEQAKLAAAELEVPVGAVIVRNGEVVSVWGEVLLSSPKKQAEQHTPIHKTNTKEKNLLINKKPLFIFLLLYDKEK